MPKMPRIPSRYQFLFTEAAGAVIAFGVLCAVLIVILLLGGCGGNMIARKGEMVDGPYGKETRYEDIKWCPPNTTPNTVCYPDGVADGDIADGVRVYALPQQPGAKATQRRRQFKAKVNDLLEKTEEKYHEKVSEIREFGKRLYGNGKGE